METQLLFTNRVSAALDDVVRSLNASGVLLLADVNTASAVVPLLRRDSSFARDAELITIPAGDEAKTLDTASIVWQELVSANATRRSVLVNVGGGMVTDLGGFVAATYRRGMPCVNIPTTVLGAVDAAVGGKTAVNFSGLKNLVGVFSMPAAVIISTVFFSTLPAREITSGYAEMIKHGLLKGSSEYAALIAGSPVEAVTSAPDTFIRILEESVKVKADIVAADPCEHGLRKALNLGHTAGHAFEELALSRGRAIPHGYAVAYGLVVMAALSAMKYKLPSSVLHTLADYVSAWYGAPEITCDDYPELIRLMQHDKKNLSSDAINFTLLRTPGQPVIDCIIPPSDITAALDITRDLLHL